MPRFAKVVAVADAPASAGLCDDFRPRFSVDLQVMGPDGEVDTALPVLAGVPLPMPVGGDEMGFFAFPEEGTSVVVCFVYGPPHKPYIQTILPHGLTLPKVPKGGHVWQHSDAVQQRVDADGKWLRKTDGKIQDQAIEREVDAMTNTESFQSHTRTVDGHSTESVGGVKRIEALGAQAAVRRFCESCGSRRPAPGYWPGFEPGDRAEAQRDGGWRHVRADSRAASEYGGDQPAPSRT
ncbi:putative prophage PSSB64-01, Orf35 [Pseudomonas syringae pv. lapsa]|uniref:Prophage PSSB64-01, Orf35 n=1 Tax=Pseudomonas syringae pv. lapsa TaxID=199201 RepID=A0AB74A8M1_PSESX|nr:putative prophage PSSB64-01, Orf35 [Pseudomonas syringae pv. lapsa]RML19475.1 putative prophage PSSB64-01, Orf35 [Pseudomonas syringae pv. lapsa]RML27294.1 putative prophage PSSB64-01, Orf35 [Pseudomonas syringae pv. lapsa]